MSTPPFETYGSPYGEQLAPPSPVISQRNPLPTDLGYQPGTIWVNSVAHTTFILSGAGNWGSTGGGSSGVNTIQSQSPVGNNFNFTDGGTGAINFSGAPGTVTASVKVDGTTITINGSDQLSTIASSSTFAGNTGTATPAAGLTNVVGSNPLSSNASGNTVTFSAATATTSQIGVVTLATNAQAIAGTDTSNAVTSAALASKLGTQTAHGIALGEGTSSPLNYSAALTNGQLLIGSSGVDPVPALLTAGAGITITPAPGSITIAATGTSTTFMEDSGSATPSGGILNINGTASQGLTTSGAGNTVTLTNTSATTSQIGVSALSTNAQAIAGVSTNTSVTPVALAAKLGTQTAHGVALGEGVGSALAYTAVGANGFLLTGMTAADPMFAALGTNSGLTAHGVLLGEGNSPIVATAALGNGALVIGSAGVDPVVANITAGSGVTIVNGPGTITISSSAITWSTITASQAIVAGNGYIVTSGAVTLSLPATSAVGDTFNVSLQGGTSWSISQGAGQSIRVGNLSSTVGAGGSLSSNAQGDGLQLVCSVANLGWFSPVGPEGNLTLI